MRLSCKTFVFLLPALLAVNVTAVYSEQTSIKFGAISLSQPDDVLRYRIPIVQELGDYIKKVEAAAVESFQSVGDLKPTTGAIVIAVKPRYQAKFWLMSSEYPIPKSISEDFQARFDKIRPIAIQLGPVAFALHFVVNGGGKPLLKENNPMPIPPEWEEAVNKSAEPLLMPDGFLAIVWPDDPVLNAPGLIVPDGFELQTLDVTKGSVLKPKGWFYNFSNNQQSLVWTISKENPHPNGYKTGFRIQLIPGVSKNTKKSAQATAEEINLSLQKTKTVLHQCDPEQDGDFTRVCLETKEEITVAGEKADYHILYSVSWSNKLDMIAITIFGTPYNEWDMYQDTYAQMKHVIIIGKEFLQKKQANSH